MNATTQATGLLGSMIYGLTRTHQVMGADTPDISASDFEVVGENGIATTLHLPNNEGSFRVTVEPV